MKNLFFEICSICGAFGRRGIAIAAVCIFTVPGVDASDSIVNFHGIVIAGTCNITSGADQTVILGDVSTMSFGNQGDVSTAKPFSIVIDCPAGGPDQATVTFSGTAASNSDLLALDTGAGTAAGVAIRINESTGTLIKLGTSSAVKALATGANTLTYQAQYQSLVDRPVITAGAANATAQFTINYP